MKRYLLALFLCAGAAVAQVPPPHPVFSGDKVHEIRLKFPNADWYQVLTENYDGVRVENPYFPASLEWGDYKFETIGVRFKGNSSYSGANTKKKPFRIKLNEFVKGQKIEGIGSFSLSNGLNDPSMVRENVYYELARALGLKASRTNYAALYVNDEYWGLYVLTEVVNSDFLKNYFGKGEDTGNMYKGNIGASFAYLGEDPTAYAAVWEKQSNEEANDWTDLIALCKLISDTPAEQLREKLEPLMDIDSFLTSMALDNATVNLDSYVGMGQNFNIYRRPSDGRWVWIPWDPSLAFGAFPGGVTGQAMFTLPLEWTQSAATGQFPGGGVPPQLPPGAPGVPQNPNPGQFPGGGFGGQNAGRPLATKVWAVPEWKERYRQIYQQLVDKVFLQEPVLARMNTLREMIRPWYEKDTQKLSTMEQFDNAMTAEISATQGTPALPGTPPGPGNPGRGPGGGLGGSAPGLKPLVEGRLAGIRTLLAETPISVVAAVADQSTVALTAASGKASDTQKVTVSLNGTTTPGFYSVLATTEPGGSWLNVAPAGGKTGTPFEVSASKMDAGVYTATLSVFCPGAANSPLIIPVTLTVTK